MIQPFIPTGTATGPFWQYRIERDGEFTDWVDWSVDLLFDTDPDGGDLREGVIYWLYAINTRLPLGVAGSSSQPVVTSFQLTDSGRVASPASGESSDPVTLSDVRFVPAGDATGTGWQYKLERDGHFSDWVNWSEDIAFTTDPEGGDLRQGALYWLYTRNPSLDASEPGSAAQVFVTSLELTESGRLVSSDPDGLGTNSQEASHFMGLETASEGQIWITKIIDGVRYLVPGPSIALDSPVNGQLLDLFYNTILQTWELKNDPGLSTLLRLVRSSTPENKATAVTELYAKFNQLVEFIGPTNLTLTNEGNYITEKPYAANNVNRGHYHIEEIQPGVKVLRTFIGYSNDGYLDLTLGNGLPSIRVTPGGVQFNVLAMSAPASALSIRSATRSTQPAADSPVTNFWTSQDIGGGVFVDRVANLSQLVTAIWPLLVPLVSSLVRAIVGDRPKTYTVEEECTFTRPAAALSYQEITVDVPKIDGDTIPHLVKSVNPKMTVYSLQDDGTYQLDTTITYKLTTDPNNITLNIPGGGPWNGGKIEIKR